MFLLLGLFDTTLSIHLAHLLCFFFLSVLHLAQKGRANLGVYLEKDFESSSYPGNARHLLASSTFKLAFLAFSTCTFST